jgi:L-threonylcarbamoyladenylate synthase
MLTGVGYHPKRQPAPGKMKKYFKRVEKVLENGGVGVLPTDTLYGLVGSALSLKAVTRIYQLKKRDPKKPFIILINSLADLKSFKIKIGLKTRSILAKYWPGKVSIILPCSSGEFNYLHCGGKTLAFRLPDKKDLRNLLKKTGPLVAPTANLEGLEPAKTIKEARAYFGDQVDFYLNQGRLDSSPSTLIALKRGKVVVKRTGAVKISD